MSGVRLHQAKDSPPNLTQVPPLPIYYEYEIDDVVYEHDKPLGAGNNAIATRLKPQRPGSPPMVEISPRDETHPNIDEAKRKKIFFSRFYPNETSELLEVGKGSYRLIVPYKEGEDYTKVLLRSNKIIALIVIYYLALALQKLHEQGLIYFDLAGPNVLWFLKNCEINLIDGGTSYEVNTVLSYKSSESDTHSESDASIPPEFLSSAGAPFGPTTDVYRLAKITEIYFKASNKSLPGSIETLFKQCTDQNPQQRPELNHVINTVQDEVVQAHISFLTNLQALLQNYKPSLILSPIYYKKNQLAFGFRGLQKYFAKRTALKLINAFLIKNESDIKQIAHFQIIIKALLFDAFCMDITNQVNYSRSSRFFALLKNGFEDDTQFLTKSLANSRP